MKEDIVKIIRMDLNGLINSFRINILRRIEAIVLTVLTANITSQRGKTFKQYQKITAPIALRMTPTITFLFNIIERFDSDTSTKPYLKKRFPKEYNIPQTTGKIIVISILLFIYF
jgi:hypothetical protein